MSFGTDFRTLITSDSTLNSLVNGGIYYENLPDNFDLTKFWIVYSYNKSEQIDSINQKNILSRYAITIKIIGSNTSTVDNITNYLTSFLNGNKYNQIRDIWQINDVKGLNLEMSIYSTELEFESFYS